MSTSTNENHLLDFGLLGPLEVRRGGALLPLGGRQQRVVLARLLVDPGRSVSVDQIADAIWGDRLPGGYLTTVQTYVFHLREMLEPDRPKGSPGRVLVTVAGGAYRLDVPLQAVDASRFEDGVAQAGVALEANDVERAAATLNAALGLWRGDVLSDLADLPFVGSAASRLSEVRLAATEDWVDTQLALGRHAALVPELGVLVEQHPLRERLQGQRMLALYRSGRQAEALAAYRVVRALLDDELGVTPGPELQILHERILRQDPGLAERHPYASDSLTDEGGRQEAGHHEAGVRAAPRETAGAVSGAPAGSPAPITVQRSRRWFAMVAVVVMAVGFIGAGTYQIARTGVVTPMPPNSTGLLTASGLDGDAIALGASPVALTEAGGSVWVVNQTEQNVVRIDPRTRRVVQTIQDVGRDPEAIASSGKDVWVAATTDGSLARINIAADKLVAKIPVGIQPVAVAATADDVWVANSGDNTVQHVDPATGRADRAIPVGDGPDGLALDGTTLWVANGRSGSLTQIDTRTGERVAADIYVDSGPSGIAVTPTDIWVTNQLSQSVSRVSRATGQVARIAVGDGPSSVVVADDGVWVSNAYAGSVSRIDTGTASVTRLDVRSSVRALARVGEGVWAVSGAFSDGAHVGGTMTVATGPGAIGDGGSIDPAVAYSPFVLELLRPVYDGLVAFRAAGSAAQTLVPDLATELPRPSDGGRTYVFTLRSGIRYSDGRGVRASDFVLGTRRALLAKLGAPEFFASIVGARGCIDHPDFPNLCDLSSGVVADDASGRVTFHLAAADPEFLYKLTLFIVATPPGTPVSDQSLTPVPSTGPYMVTKVAPSGDLTLSRNPYFAQWSFPAQPSGYPDVIVRRTWPTRAEAGADVLAGSADVADVLVPGFAVAHPSQTHRFDTRNTDFVYLNHHVAPFDDVRVRRALNYAVDRRELVRLYGQGDGFATLTCQMIPPGFPSYRRYCPYQSGPADGPYLGPDPARARELVKESGTSGMTIVIHALPGPGIYAAFPSHLATILTGLGYVVRIEDIPAEVVNADIRQPPYSTYQLFTQLGWLADYPVASSFYTAIAGCGRPTNVYCNPTIDASARRAYALEGSDPNASLAAWTAVDRQLTDDAAFVALGNHGGTQVVSERVGNYQAMPGLGAILSQLWVK